MDLAVMSKSQFHCPSDRQRSSNIVGKDATRWLDRTAQVDPDNNTGHHSSLNGSLEV